MFDSDASPEPSSDNHLLLAQRCRTMQILVAALVSGVVTFLGFVVFPFRPEVGDPLLAYVGFALAVAAIGAWLVVPKLVTSKMVSAIASGNIPPTLARAVGSDRSAVSLLSSVYQTRLILASALLEGAAFFNVIAYMFEGHWLSIGVVLILLVMLLSGWPTVGRLDSWIRRQQENVQLEWRR